jgi:hypothetical protein
MDKYGHAEEISTERIFSSTGPGTQDPLTQSQASSGRAAGGTCLSFRNFNQELFLGASFPPFFPSLGGVLWVGPSGPPLRSPPKAFRSVFTFSSFSFSDSPPLCLVLWSPALFSAFRFKPLFPPLQPGVVPRCLPFYASPSTSWVSPF